MGCASGAMTWERTRVQGTPGARERHGATRKPPGYHATAVGPIPASGISLPGESTLGGPVRLSIPGGGVPDGFQCRIATVLSNADTGEYVHEDYCDLTINHP